MEPNPNCTVFVRSLPFNTTNESLERIFSEVGPVKKCFVVKQKDSEKNKGYGYVQFSTREDASRAKELIKSVGKRKVFVEYAASKPNRKDKKAKKMERIEVSGGEDTKEQADFKKTQHTRNKTKPEKKFRLILRNLSFKVEASDLQKTFEQFGKLKELNIPKNSDGTKKGFAFLQFDSSVAAIKAMKLNGTKIKGRPIVLDWAVAKNRYQLSEKKKSTHAEDHEKTKSGKTTQKAESDKSSAISSDENSESDDEDQESDSDKSDDEGNNISSTQNEYDSDRAYDDSDDNSDFETDRSLQNKSDSYITKTPSNKELKISKQKNKVAKSDSDIDSSENESENDISGSENTESESENSESDNENSSLSETDENELPEDVEKTKKKPRKRPSDVEEGRTLFIRNLPYECVDDDVHEEFSKFGELNYAAVVIDPKTEHSRGTAFVQFKKKEHADACLEECSSSTQGITMNGRVLLVTVAVKKSKAEKLRTEKKENKQDKDQGGRNLWLAREGLIRQGSQAAEGLSKVDLAKRLKLEVTKRQKLKNPNMFISTTRLSIHNLPTSVTDRQLRTAVLKLVDDKSAHIDECRVMRDMKNVNSKGVGKSRGYAFVNFTQHAHALEALRALNNNSELYGDKKRPIVEFSIENRLALAAKEKRKERSKMKEVVLKSSNKKGTYSGLQKKKKEKKSADDPTVAKPPENMQKGMKALPSHWGPKIRHKGKTEPAKSKKRKPSNQQKHPPEKKQKLKQPIKSREKTDHFDQLVNKYKQTLTKSLANKKSKTKWFNT